MDYDVTYTYTTKRISSYKIIISDIFNMESKINELLNNGYEFKSPLSKINDQYFYQEMVKYN